MTTNDPNHQPGRHHILWNDFDDAVQDTTDQIVASRSLNQITNDMFIGIQMGGLPLMTAVINRLKDKYHYKIDNLQIATTSAYRPCVKALSDQFNNHIDTGNGQSRIWLFEDIVDTGNTIGNLVSRLITIGRCNIQWQNITVVAIVDRTPAHTIFSIETNANALAKCPIIAGQTLKFDSNTFITFPWEVQQ